MMIYQHQSQCKHIINGPPREKTCPWRFANNKGADQPAHLRSLIIPRNMIINLGCASVDKHIPLDNIFGYHPQRECNIYIILTRSSLGFLHIFFCKFVPELWHLIYTPITFSTQYLVNKGPRTVSMKDCPMSAYKVINCLISQPKHMLCYGYSKEPSQ